MPKSLRENHPGGRSRQVLELKNEARRQRLISKGFVKSGTDTKSVEFHAMEADRLERTAVDLLRVEGKVVVGAGGEVANAEYMRNTLAEDPNAVNIAASAERCDLLEQAGVSDLALDAAESVQAPNSLEQMMIHQMGLAHEQVFRLTVEANAESNTVEKARLLNCAARMMKCYQDALLTLNRVRSGGVQRVVVQHVQVNDGGQAVVAGEVKGGGKNDGG